MFRVQGFRVVFGNGKLQKDGGPRVYNLIYYHPYSGDQQGGSWLGLLRNIRFDAIVASIFFSIIPL